MINLPFETIERAQGMPGEGLTHGPPAEKMQAAGTTGAADHPAFPAQWFDGLYALSLETGSIAYMSRQCATRIALDASTGASGPHDFTVRIGKFVGARNPRCNPTRPPHPAPTFVTTRVHPSAWGRTAAVKHDLRKNEREILRAEGPAVATQLTSLAK